MALTGRVMVLLVLAGAILGCRNIRQFHEARLYHAGDLIVDRDDSGATTSHRTPLTLGSEVLHPEWAVHHGDPLAIVVRRVYIPIRYDWFSGSDVVVLVDIGLAPGKEQRNIAVHYEEAVPADAALNFQDLLVYSVLNYDRAYAPIFRVKLLDLDKQEAEAARGLLDQAGEAVSALGSFTPNPYVPAINVAMKLGAALVSANKDDVILDYKFQLYPLALPNNTGATGTGVLQVGDWVALGIPNDVKAKEQFWSKKLAWDNAKSRLVDENGEVVRVPAVVFSIRRQAMVRPAMLQERSAEILQLIERDQSGTAMAELGAVMNKAMSAGTTMGWLKGLISGRTMADWRNVFKSLADPNLSKSDRNQVMKTLSRLTPDDVQLGSAQEWVDWWSTVGHKGSIAPDSGRWNPPSG